MHAQIRIKQNGIALLMLMLVLALTVSFLIVSTLSARAVEEDRERKTAAALALAKDALIAYAVSVDLTGTCFSGTNCPRPGDLPCPDTNNDGLKEASCGDAPGSTQQANRLRRLPWTTLALGDLRDGYGERLWYAVSNNFKENTRYAPLNSDTFGTITIRDSSGNVIYNAGTQTGVAAVIIAPGPAITRLGAATSQDRSCSSSAVCNDPTNYLDTNGTEDNATFQDGSATDGFINGPILDGNRNVIVNDRLITITLEEITHAVEKRVIGEVRSCLQDYAKNNNGMYPWTAPLNPFVPPSYDDAMGNQFGRVPDTPFVQTKATNAALSDTWTFPCNIRSNAGWWSINLWKEMTFYGVANPFKPSASPPSGCGLCLTVSGVTTLDQKQIVVISAGKMLPGKSRTGSANKGTIGNYLEGENATAYDGLFERRALTDTFNDQIVVLPAP